MTSGDQIYNDAAALPAGTAYQHGRKCDARGKSRDQHRRTISATDGNVTVTGNGGIDISGTITASSTTGTVTLTDSAAYVQEDPASPATTGKIIASTLITASKSGTTLNNPNNQVGNFQADDEPAAADSGIQLENGKALDIPTYIIETNGPVVVLPTTEPAPI